ncbi:hypothetical protein T492DRAFT_1018678 [Pavlovales sp. CCMP2436]|nr:hypothetical protein T492DRAFT_1018678 [Pavlovales sp. CCMP2436]|mmetsp:Transcript_31469/g.72355  ORF Transcript_31469/g.72355 Transcript_31469/m.72355 type:complete len:162 (+) Transcript_31469:441-926(+)
MSCLHRTTPCSRRSRPNSLPPTALCCPLPAWPHVPEESQVKPGAGQELGTPLKSSLRPAEVEQPTPECEVHEDDVGFTITVHGAAPEGAHVKIDGNLAWVRCKAEGGSTPFSRAFELPRYVYDASEITAKLTEAVPKDALDTERKIVRKKIAVQKTLAASA